MFYILVTIKCIPFILESKITKLHAITSISDSFNYVVFLLYQGLCNTTEIRFCSINGLLTK